MRFQAENCRRGESPRILALWLAHLEVVSRVSRFNAFDGDKSPAQSGDKSPHSIPASVLSMECGEFSPLWRGDSSPSNVQRAASSEGESI
jgi:hypothetical protein